MKAPRRIRTGRATPPDLLAAHGLYFADEALSVVRHDVLNRMTAVGALSFELRRAFAEGSRDPGRNLQREVVAQARLADLNRQLSNITAAVSRRLAPPVNTQPDRALVHEAVESVLALRLWPVTVEVARPAAPVVVVMAPRELEVVLLCALDNAAEASQGGRRAAARPAVTIGWQLRPEGDLAIDIVDNGPGFAADVEERAFERFFTTKPGHPGLGLSVIRSVLLRRGGHVQLGNVQASPRARGARGARVTLVVPAASAPTRRRKTGRA